MTRDEFANELRGIAATNLFQEGIVDEDKVHDQMAWLACLYEAQVISESCTLKDIAHLVRNGMPAFNLDEWLNGLDFEDEDDATNILDLMRLF